MADSTSNPFADPYEHKFQMEEDLPTANVTSLDDYDPFGAKPSAVTPPQTVAAPQSSANIGAAIQPPAYQPEAQQIDTAELQRRQEELESKAAKLEKETQNKTTTGEARPKNFPPFPEGCCVRPCFRQEFETDIPSDFRRVAKAIYFSYILRAVVLTLNFLFSIGYLALTPDYLLAAERTLGLALFHLLWWILLGFLCWHRAGYSALGRDSALSYFWFLFVTAWNILVDIFMILGPAGTGYLGILTGAALLDDRYNGQDVRNMGAAVMFIVAGSVLLLVMDLYLLKKVHGFYRRSGVTMQQAQSEFKSGAWKNQHVQAAGAVAVSSAASGVMAGAGNNVTGRVQN